MANGRGRRRVAGHAGMPPVWGWMSEWMDEGVDRRVGEGTLEGWIRVGNE